MIASISLACALIALPPAFADNGEAYVTTGASPLYAAPSNAARVVHYLPAPVVIRGEPTEASWTAVSIMTVKGLWLEGFLPSALLRPYPHLAKALPQPPDPYLLVSGAHVPRPTAARAASRTSVRDLEDLEWGPSQDQPLHLPVDVAPTTRLSAPSAPDTSTTSR